jgi:predicted ATPase
MDPGFKASRVEGSRDIFSVLQETKQGDILLLSHPEERLSAFQQVALGEAIAIVGSAGVQVVVEYTSEHLFNGVRLQIKRKVIDHSDVTLIHLEKDRVLYIPIGKDARLHYWPTGSMTQSSVPWLN